ncbi:MAG: putative dehydrogenase [Conexibacter sp.]|nr:putative dehydrogenase [Conexibacter sp.]
MATIGIFLSCEEQSAKRLVDIVVKAEDAGFRDLWISDHFHPWIDAQGESPFVWSVIGAIAAATREVHVTTAVTCPTVRIHPAIVAQAAATSSILLDGRFALGVGTGEALNEHILGDPWPGIEQRLSMLEESVAIMRELWAGGNVSYDGTHYVVDRARLYSLPERAPHVLVSAFGPQAASTVGAFADGYINVAPDPDLLSTYRDAGGRGPAQGGMKICWGADEAECVRTVHRLWPNEALGGELAQVLPMPAHYESAVEAITEEMVAEAVPCGPDVEKHVAAIQEFVDAGYDEVYVNQIGDDQEGFLKFMAADVLPRFA